MLDPMHHAWARSWRRSVPLSCGALLLNAAAGCGRIGVEVQVSAQEGAADAGEEQLDASLVDAETDDGTIADASEADEASAPADADITRDAEAQLDATGVDAESPLDAAPSGDGSVCASNPDAYVPIAECGLGYCRSNSSPSGCANGVEVACRPAAPRSASDSSCDGVDDDCDGDVDEDYVAPSTSCGRGVCARAGMARCIDGAVRDSCQAGPPTSSVDDDSGSGNGLDDDCDGQVDEDIPGCDTTPRAFEAGHHSNVPVPAGCGRVSVRLWGGGGASGDDLTQPGAAGAGGAGGYASLTTPITGAISLSIGEGGAEGCDEGGAAGSASYSGGSGGSAMGAPGADGMVPEGGAGGMPSAGNAGGRGHFGGGGGGQGSAGLGSAGHGGGGGAASVFIMNGVRVVLAGGGGGGGGAHVAGIFGSVEAGGDGGGGCSGIGQVATARGGGGGGGGVCDGFATRLGTGVSPAFSEDVPDGRAQGGSGSCAAGGAGYAILTFSR